MVSRTKAEAMTKAQLVDLAARRKSRKVTKGRALARTLGVFPFAPVRLMRNAGWFNAWSSVFLGKDIANGFDGNALTSGAEIAAGGRRDIIKFLGTEGGAGALRAKLAGVPDLWMRHIKSIGTKEGFSRTATPAIVGEVTFQAAKALNANQIVPAGLKQFIKVV